VWMLYKRHFAIGIGYGFGIYMSIGTLFYMEKLLTLPWYVLGHIVLFGCLYYFHTNFVFMVFPR
jgi:hypothetical protein